MDSLAGIFPTFALHNGRVRATLLSRPRNRLSGLFLGGTATLGFALIPQLFTFGECKLQFRSTVLKVHSGGNEGETLLLGFANQLSDFFLVDQQLPRAQGCMVVDIPVLVFSDVAVEKPKFAVLDDPIGVPKADFSGSH